MIVVYCSTKQMKTFSIDKIMTTESGKIKGPPSSPEWTFGRAREDVTQCEATVYDDR